MSQGEEAENRVASLVTSGFVLGESPRWHNGRFWFSDIFGGHVYSVEERGDLRVEVTIDRPSGLGWLPDGSLVVSTLAREKAGQLVGPARIVRVDESGQHNLVEVTEDNVGFNDMVVHSNGLAYVNFYRGTGGDHDEIWMVKPDGTVACVADELSHPNGMVITPDGGTLLACETYAHRVIAFTVASDGTLSDKRDFATDIPWADGLCLDSAGAVWVGSLFAGEFLRAERGGAVTHRVAAPSGHWALAPMLGGPDRRTLFMLTAETDPQRAGNDDSHGFLQSIRVDIPGAGWP